MAQRTEKEEATEFTVVPEKPSISIPAAAAAKPPPQRFYKIARSVSGERIPNRTAEVVEESSRPEATEEKKREVNRCSGCRKKVGLTGFRCRCGDLFCSEHRYSDRHVCSYDYKAAGRDAIARENPIVKAAKIIRL